MATHFPSPASVSITPRSTLVLEGNVVVETLELDGCLVVKAAPGATVTLRGLKVQNAGWRFVPTEESDEPRLKIRGYRLQKDAQRVVEAAADTIVSE